MESALSDDVTTPTRTANAVGNKFETIRLPRGGALLEIAVSLSETVACDRNKNTRSCNRSVLGSALRPSQGITLGSDTAVHSLSLGGDPTAHSVGARGRGGDAAGTWRGRGGDAGEATR